MQKEIEKHCKHINCIATYTTAGNTKNGFEEYSVSAKPAIDTFFPHWKNLHRLSKWLVPLGIIGIELRAPLKPPRYHITMMLEEFQGAINRDPPWCRKTLVSRAHDCCRNSRRALLCIRKTIDWRVEIKATQSSSNKIISNKRLLWNKITYHENKVQWKQVI